MYVCKKACRQWVWLAIDRKTRDIIGVHIGDRSAKSAAALWQSIPDIYCRYATVYTDYWSSYNDVIPEKQHYSVGKETGLTNPIERFNNTFTSTPFSFS